MLYSIHEYVKFNDSIPSHPSIIQSPYMALVGKTCSHRNHPKLWPITTYSTSLPPSQYRKRTLAPRHLQVGPCNDCEEDCEAVSMVETYRYAGTCW